MTRLPMFDFLKKSTPPAPVASAQAQLPRQSLFGRLRSTLASGAAAIARDLSEWMPGRRIDAELLEELELRLLTADVGLPATERILSDLRKRVARNEVADLDALIAALRRNVAELLHPVARPLMIPTDVKPFVILVVGVNGSGKTTSIGKLAHRLLGEGRTVVLAAGDTFRAAAVEQLQVWGERNGVPVIAQASGADPAAVIFDGYAAAKARGADVLLADTAGRLQNQTHLMDELRKVKRVLGRHDDTAPHEVLLVLDASQGQNALTQALVFQEAVGVTGLVLTKLDGSAKGGIIIAIATELGIPLRFVGVGESIEDFGIFDVDDFVDSLIAAPPSRPA